MMKASILVLAGLLAGACAGEFVDCMFTADLDGTEQRYLLDAPEGAKDVIVWLHGHGSDRTQVQQERGECKSARDIAAERGMAICSPDYRAMASWMGPTAEADMLQLIGILTNSFTGRIFLVGGSMGGTSALTFAARHPSLVAGVTAFNPLADHLSYANFQDAIAASFGGTKTEIPDEYRTRSALYFPEAFTMPLAVTLGGKDTTIPPDSARALVKAVGKLHPGYVYLDDDPARGHETDLTASTKALREMFRMADKAHPIFAGGATQTIAHWNFDVDPLGVTDASGHSNTLTNNGVRIVDGAAVFDGSPHAFSTMRPFRFVDRTTYTIECFVRSATTDAASYLLVEVSPDAGGQDRGAFLCYPDGAMNHRYNFNTSPAGHGWTGRKCGINVLDTEWHHLAAVFSPPANAASPAADAPAQVMFYIDGVLQPTYDQWQYGNVDIGGFTLFIGSRNNNACMFKGSIDDVRVTRGALAPEQFLKERSQPKTVVAYWPFDTPETALVDATGNGNDLTSDSGVAFTNGYASFNGQPHVMNTVNTLDLSPYTDVTVEYFFRAHPGNDATQMVLEQSENIADNVGGFFMTFNEWGAGSLTASIMLSDFWHIDSTTQRTWDNKLPASIPRTVSGGWHHIAMVRDSSRTGNNAWRFYLDGFPQAQGPSYIGEAKCYLANKILYFGSRANQGIWLDADLDDVRITAGVLQPGEFMRTRSGAPTDEDVIAYWPFDKRAPLVDASGNGNDLENDGVTFSKEGCAVFSGAQKKFSTAGTFSLATVSSLTVEFFMRTVSFDCSMVLETGDSFFTEQLSGGFCACLNEGWKPTPTADIRPASEVGGSLEAGFQTTYPNAGCCLDWSTDVADGKWHHYAVIYDHEASPAERLVKFYKDGVLQTGKRAGPGSQDFKYQTMLRTARLYIGSRNDSTLWFTGELDDVRITGRALDPSEFLQRRSRPKGLSLTLR